MLIGIPLPDWITLTSFNQQSYKSVLMLWQRHAYWHASLDGRSAPVVKQRVMQYNGISVDGVFFGEAVQNGQPHYMIRASGELCHRLWSSVKMHGFKCTRVDLQVTIEQPPLYDTIALRDQLLKAKWAGRRTPRIKAIYSDDGMDTVYIGSRTSERFVRIYVKADDDKFRYLRYEIELKGKFAQSVYESMIDDYAGTVSGVLADSVNRIDRRVYAVSYFASELSAYKAKKVDGRVVRAGGGSMDWLINQVEPAIKKMANDHEKRQSVIDWLNKLIIEVNKDEQIQATSGSSEGVTLGLGGISDDGGVMGAFSND